MQDRLEYAERRLEEEIRIAENTDFACGTHDIDYWRGYRDAVKRMMEEQEKKFSICPRCGSYSFRYLKICNDTVSLVECVVCGWNSILPKETEEKNND